MRSEIDKALAEKKFIRMVYETIDAMGVSTAYEGFIERIGVQVRTYDSRQVVCIDKSIDLEKLNLKEAFKFLLSNLEYDRLNFFCCAILNHKLIWGQS